MDSLIGFHEENETSHPSELGPGPTSDSESAPLAPTSATPMSPIGKLESLSLIDRAGDPLIEVGCDQSNESSLSLGLGATTPETKPAEQPAAQPKPYTPRNQPKKKKPHWLKKPPNQPG